MTKVMQMHDFSHANAVLQDWKDWRTDYLGSATPLARGPANYQKNVGRHKGVTTELGPHREVPALLAARRSAPDREQKNLATHSVSDGTVRP